MQDVTILILTKNEEKNLSLCLESVKGFAKRCVVVDSGSTDRTKEIAFEYVKHGFYIGIGGTVTFKNARKTKEVVESIPIESIVPGTFYQSASYVPCAEPCACTFFLIFDLHVRHPLRRFAAPLRDKFTFKLTFDL